MQKYSDVVLSPAGTPVAGAVITVTTYPDGSAATIYAADGGPSVASVTTNVNGRFSFYAPNGHYSILVSGTGITPVTYNDVVLYDPKDDGTGIVSWLRAATGAIKTTVAKWLGWQDISVFEFMTDAQISDVKARTYTLDVTAAIQAADAASRADGKTLKFPRGGYLAGALVLYAGSIWRGSNWFPSDWRVPAMALTNIRTTGVTVDQAALNQGYIWGINVANLTLEGTNVAGSKGLYLKKVASSLFENIGITKFARGLEIEYGMMNEYNWINSSGCTDTSFFLNGNATTTTQTFNRCVGRESPWAWVMESTASGNVLGTVLNGCVVESTTVGGINQHKSCSAEYNSIYCENAPDDRATTTGTLLRLFKDGVDFDQYRSVAILNGGDLAGGNFGLFTASTAIDIGSAKHVAINGTEIQRATNGIRWDSTTSDGAIKLTNPAFVQVTTLYTGPAGKMSGIYPDGNLTVAHKNVISAEQIGEEGTWTATMTPGAGTITMGANTGSYTKIGRMVHVSGLFTVGSVAAPSGLLKLNGLPYACGGGYKSQVAATVNAWFLTGVSTPSTVTAVINYGTSYIEIDLFNNGSPQNMGANIAAGTQIHVSAFYPAS